MDAEFNPYNNPIDVWSVSNADMADLIQLFSTRFNRAHFYTDFEPGKSFTFTVIAIMFNATELCYVPKFADDIKRLATLFGDFKYSKNTDIQIFFKHYVYNSVDSNQTTEEKFIEPFQILVSIIQTLWQD